MGGILGSESVNLVDCRNYAEGLAPLADGEASLLHLHAVLQANGTSYLEVGETINLSSAQYVEDLWRTQVFHELAGFHKLRDFRQMDVFFELLVDIDKML